MKLLPLGLRAQVFRDDCHLNELGAALAAASICAALRAMCTFAAPVHHLSHPLPPPVHPKPWGRGRAEVRTIRCGDSKLFKAPLWYESDETLLLL